jgi:hypothetical protein
MPMYARSSAQTLVSRLRQFRIGHCPGCGTTVRADDGLGFIGLRIAHAECSLVRANRRRAGDSDPVGAGASEVRRLRW